MHPSTDTHYDVLGVNSSAGPDEIRKSYRRLSLRFHPDRSEGDVEKYQTINEAYEVLSDASRRMSYDIQLKFSNASASANANGLNAHGLNAHGLNAHGLNAHGLSGDVLSDLFGSLGGQSLNVEDISVLLGAFANRAGGGVHSTDGTMDGGDVLSRLFSVLNRILGDKFATSAAGGNIPGGRSAPVPVPSPAPAPGDAVLPDIRMDLVLDLEQAYNGCSLPLRVTRTLVFRDDYAPISVFTDNRRTESATIYIEVPKGIDQGEVIRVAGAGHCRYGVYGDVCVTIVLRPHDVYDRDGLNLIYTRTISLTDSLCGFSFDIEHFGKTYTICNNAGNVIPSNHRKVVPEKGMRREGHSGDLIVHFKVIYPKTISLEACEWLRGNLEASAS